MMATRKYLSCRAGNQQSCTVISKEKRRRQQAETAGRDSRQRQQAETAGRDSRLKPAKRNQASSPLCKSDDVCVVCTTCTELVLYYSTTLILVSVRSVFHVVGRQKFLVAVRLGDNFEILRVVPRRRTRGNSKR